MPHITDTERRAQRQRDYAAQIAMLQKQAWDGSCEPVGIRLEERDGLCVVRFHLFHRDDDNTGHGVRATGATFREAFERVYEAMPRAIRNVCADAAFAAECRGEPEYVSPAERRAEARAEYFTNLADEARHEARAAS